jgi:hypothetical protein
LSDYASIGRRQHDHVTIHSQNNNDQSPTAVLMTFALITSNVCDTFAKKKN